MTLVSVYLTFYCNCGAARTYRGPDGTFMTREIERIRQMHLALGHIETTAAKAARARRNAEMMEAAQ